MIDTGLFNKESVHDANVLIVRSETKVDRKLLEGSHIKFVGTATAGIDHLDVAYLESQGITYTNAPGCNSNSVKEYIVAALLHISAAKGFSLKGKTIGIVGVGNVGTKVVKATEALGMNVLQNDPPLARKSGDKRFVPLDDLMTSDVITLHVPLTLIGEDKTYHLFNNEIFNRLKDGAILINTSRGAVVETEAFKKAIISDRLGATIVDVWENEPSIDEELLSMVTIGTPHIAGYSMDGKINGLLQVRNAICEHFCISSWWNPPNDNYPERVVNIPVSTYLKSSEEILDRIVKDCYDISLDDKYLRRMFALPIDERPGYFQRLRTEYRIRREFSNITVRISKEHAVLRSILTKLGFDCND